MLQYYKLFITPALITITFVIVKFSHEVQIANKNYTEKLQKVRILLKNDKRYFFVIDYRRRQDIVFNIQ